ncbi:MAG TPA: site-2 protease family protein [Steroidobacteraceae bacterium]|nr:site-2 protease family protein [Steroidobacteraceae bacterium]
MAAIAAPDNCARCGAALAPGSLACPRCQALAHGSKLEELAASARKHEQSQNPVAARADWQAALELLPEESAQAAWVRARLAELPPDAAPSGKSAAPQWTRKLGPLAPIAVLLLKGKFFLSLLKLPFLLSFAAFAGLYWGLYGARFGVGLAVLILVHEFGHFIELRRRGLAADLPMFVPGLGAYVRWTAAGVTSDARALVSLAGPLAGAVGAAFCALVWLQTQERLWMALASFSAFINLMNLIPVWRLDGGQAIVAINRTGRIAIALASVILAAYLSQPLVLLVAGGAVFRAFSKEPAADTSRSYGLSIYFIALLAVLAYLAALASLGAPPH